MSTPKPERERELCETFGRIVTVSHILANRRVKHSDGLIRGFSRLGDFVQAKAYEHPPGDIG